MTTEEYKKSLDQWEKVCKEPLFQFLKHHPTGRKIMWLLSCDKISIGKAAQSITEKFILDIEPKLPDYTETHTVLDPDTAMNVPRIKCP